MRIDPSHLFSVPIGDDWLVYAPLSAVSALVNDRAMRSLRERLSETRRSGVAPGGGDDSELFDSLASPRAIPPDRQSGPLAPGFLGLIPTRACNLSCVYCDFGADESDGGRMRLETAVSAIDWYVENAKGRGLESIDIHFFGGEPFAAPDLVDAAVHYARSRAACHDLSVRFEVSTNGLFDEARCAFVGDYFDSVVLSVDGSPETQNRYRPLRDGGPSAKAVLRNARALASSEAELCLRCCVTNENVEGLVETVAGLLEDIGPSVIDLEPLKATPRSRAFGISPPDPFRFAEAFYRCEREADSRGCRLVLAAAETGTLRSSFCPVGNDTVIVDPRGRLGACYLDEKDWRARGLDLSLGCVGPDSRLAIDDSSVARIRGLTAPEGVCASCFLRWHCAGGCRVENAPGLRRESLPDACAQARIVAALRLLRKLSLVEQAEALVSDRRLMAKLAYNPDDIAIPVEAADGE